MQQKLTTKQYIVLASMLFGMFFGSGNLIFPINMGQNAGAHMLPAVIGFCVTGVGLPILAVIAIGVSKSEGLFDLSVRAGKVFAFLFTCALYLTIGPLFAIPRNATVSFTVGVKPYLPEDKVRLVLMIFSCLFFAIALFFSLKPQGIMTWIGKLLNPAFLVLLGVLFVVVLLNPMGKVKDITPVAPYDAPSAAANFFTGFLGGYNTMDALAGLAFGIVMVNAVRNLGIKEPVAISRVLVKTGILAGALMTIIYFLTTLVGAQSVAELGVQEEGGTTFNLLAEHYLKTAGAIILACMITVACLKTAIALITSCAETFVKLFPHTLFYNAYAVIFTLIPAILANAGLVHIIAWAVPVLILLYPLTIVLIVLGIIGRYFAYHPIVFVLTVLGAFIPALPQFIASLPALPALVPWIAGAKTLNARLPLGSYGMGWLLPAAICFIIGIVLYRLFFAKKEDSAKAA